MEADFSVELGAEDETLAFPWTGSGNVQYYDLKRDSELLPLIQEARKLQSLGEFLTALNSAASLFETAKCDTWFTTELNPEEEVFGQPCKFCSYVDLLFSGDSRFSFAIHEETARRWTEILRKAPEIAAAAEFIIRRCYFANDPRDGFYITLYSFGYGEDDAASRTQWAAGLKLVEKTIREN